MYVTTTSFLYVIVRHDIYDCYTKRDIKVEKRETVWLPALR